MNITIFDSATGEIKSNVFCQVGLANAQLSQSEDFIAGEYSAEHFYIQSFVAVEKPSRPSKSHVFNYTTKQWEDPRTLADLKAAKNAAINSARLRANQSHFMFAGKQIAVDPLSRSDIDAMHGTVLMLQAMPAGWPGAWKAMDNTFVAIPDVATWGAFYGAMVAQGMQNFAHSQALKAQLDAATTPAEVEAVPVW